MYAGTTFRRDSGRIVGVHQKIDRVSRRYLNKFVGKTLKFPGIRMILNFEGKNGPDGLKFKGAEHDVPWHFIDPTDPDDLSVISMINDHIYNLAEALRVKNTIRAAFEAAWLSHAITDGLTPAHHYPLNDKIKELWGKSQSERNSVKDRIVIKGKSRRDTLSKNWEYWGVGGVFSDHLTYEMGVASAITASNFDSIDITNEDITYLINNNFETLFLESVHKIHKLEIFDNYRKSGWTTNLAMETKDVLLPEIIKMVTLAWYKAAYLSEEANI